MTRRMKLDPDRPPRLSEGAKQHYDATPDEAIDYSRTPDLSGMDWAALKVETPRAKPTVTMRLDAEVIEHFKAEDPRGYTARMAAVLRAYVASRSSR